jgi:hypothetical protein
VRFLAATTGFKIKTNGAIEDITSNNFNVGSTGGGILEILDSSDTTLYKRYSPSGTNLTQVFYVVGTLGNSKNFGGTTTNPSTTYTVTSDCLSLSLDSQWRSLGITGGEYSNVTSDYIQNNSAVLLLTWVVNVNKFVAYYSSGDPGTIMAINAILDDKEICIYQKSGVSSLTGYTRSYLPETSFTAIINPSNEIIKIKRSNGSDYYSRGSESSGDKTWIVGKVSVASSSGGGGSSSGSSGGSSGSGTRIKDMPGKTTLDDNDAFLVDNNSGTRSILATYLCSAIADKLKDYKYNFQSTGLKTIEEAFDILSARWVENSTEALNEIDTSLTEKMTAFDDSMTQFLTNAAARLNTIDERAQQISVNALASATEDLNDTVHDLIDDDVTASDISQIMGGIYAVITTPYISESDVVVDDVRRSDIQSIINGTYVIS